MAEFGSVFGRGADGAVRAPGRVNLIGEHTDYNDGFVLPIAIERQCVARWARRDDRTVRFHSAQVGETAAIDLDAPPAPTPGAWGNYPVGVAVELLAGGVSLAGADVLLDSDVPAGAGLSSSAAIEVATALALLAAAGRPGAIQGRPLALLCQRAENEFADTPCGIMDQSIAVMGRAGRAMLLDCRSGQTRQVPFDDPAWRLLVADTHDNLFFFSNRGKVFRLRCYDIPPDTSRSAKGLPLINLISMDAKELITAVVAASDFQPGWYMVMATRSGEVKRTALSDFAVVRSNGLIAMDLEKDDELIGAKLASEESQVMLVTGKGQSIKFDSRAIRTSFRTSGGVRGIRLGSNDTVISMDIVSPQDHLLTVTTQGFGKHTPVSSYPLQGRGGSGVRNFKINPKSGEVVAARKVHSSQELMVITAQGIVLRTQVQDIAIQGRATQGVRIMKPDKGDHVAAIACFDGEEKVKPTKQAALF